MGRGTDRDHGARHPQDAAIASVHGLPLYTHNPEDFVGLESRVEVIAV
jgi:hypothetical protein